MEDVNITAKPPLPRNMRLLIGMRAARSIGQGAMVAAFTLYLHALGWSATAIGAVLMGALLFGTLLTIIVGPLSDRGGRRAFLLGYDALQGMGIALLVAMPLVPWFWPAMALYITRGVSNRGTGGVRQALAAGLTRAERRGLASSLQNISIQLPRAIGPVIGGALFHAGYLKLPFLLGAVLQLGYLVLYARFFGSHEAAKVREA